MTTSGGGRRSPSLENSGRGSQPELSGRDEPRPRYVPDNPTALFPRGQQHPHAALDFPQLPQIAADFLSSVPRGDYRRSMQFITQNQESLVKPSLSGLYESEAAQSLVDGNEERALNCIEKAILIEIICTYKKSSERVAYFQAMHARETKVYAHYKSMFRQKYNNSKAKADHAVADRIHHEHSARANNSGRYSSTAYASRGSRHVTAVPNNPAWQDKSATDYQILSHDMSGLFINDEKGAGDPKKRHAPESDDYGTTPAQMIRKRDVDRGDQSQRQRAQQSSYEQRGSQAVATFQQAMPNQEQRHSGTSQPEERPRRIERTTDRPVREERFTDRPVREERITDRPVREEVDLTKFTKLSHIEEDLSKAPGNEKLDERYYKRGPREAGRLFRTGRVVSILTHHDYNGDPNSFRQTPDHWLSPGPKGTWILSHIQRYAVVKEGHGFCWAVPISTYGGQATRKGGLSLNEIEAHAIAYSTRKPPAELERERKLPKKPISIDCLEGHQLHPASRINFAKVRTIEHNVRAMDVGRVTSSSMNHFDQYWNEEMLKQWKKQT